MKITTVVEVREVTEFKIGDGSQPTIGEQLDQMLCRIVDDYRRSEAPRKEVVKEIIINIEEFIKEVIAND
jgi:hypothetical protein